MIYPQLQVLWRKESASRTDTCMYLSATKVKKARLVKVGNHNLQNYLNVEQTSDLNPSVFSVL